jgi:hypothetical protein
MDANLLLVDPRPDGKSTYIVTLPYTPAIKNALWGENRSFYAAKDVLGLNINFKANGTQLIIFPEPKRGDETLFDKPNIVKDRLDFAHGALKFWKRRVETDIALQKQLTELKVACDMWNNTDSSQVDHYFTEVPKKKDDRFNPRSDPQPEPSTASDAEAAKATKSEDVKTEKEEIETIYLQDGSVVETETTTKSREDTQATDTTWHGAGNQRSWQRATGHRFPSAKAPSKTLFAGKKVEVSEASEGDTKASGDATKAQPAAETAASETAESTKEVDKEPAKPSFSPFDDDDFSAFQPVSRSKKAAAKKRGGLGSSSG